MQGQIRKKTNVYYQSIKTLAFLIVSVLVFFGVYTFDGWTQVFVFTFYCIYVTFQEPKYLSHPWVWFTAFFLLYSISHPGLVLLGRYEIFHDLYQYDENVANILRYHFIALISFLSGTLLLNRENDISKEVNLFIKFKKHDNFRDIAWFLLYTLLTLTAIYIVGILGSGYTSKIELVNAGNNPFYLRLGSFYNLLTLVGILIILLNFKLRKTKNNYLLISLIIFWTSVSFFVSGERDHLFRFILVYFVFLYDLVKKFRLSSFYFLLVAFLALLPTTQILKGLLLGSKEFVFEKYDLSTFFNTEFQAAGRNLHHILLAKQDIFWGQTLLWDLRRAFSSDLLNIEASSTNNWFHDVFRVHEGIQSSTGWGFSLVALGYINFGICGIILIFFLFGLISKYFYLHRFKNIYWYVYYLFYITVAIYSIRQDLAVYISMNLKTVLLPLLIIYGMTKFKNILIDKQISNV